MEEFFMWLHWAMPQQISIDFYNLYLGIVISTCLYWLWVIRLKHKNEKRMSKILDITEQRIKPAGISIEEFKAEKSIVHQINKLNNVKGTRRGK